MTEFSSEHHESSGNDPGLSGRSLSVLVLDEDLPWPLNSGKPIRTWNLLRRLSRKHRLTFLCYGEPDDDRIPAIEREGIEVRTVAPPESFRAKGLALYLRLLANLFSRLPYSVDKHFSRNYRRELRSLIETRKFDLVQCEWTPYGIFLEDVSGTPAVITTHNVEAQIWRRRAETSRNPVAKLYFSLQATRMEKFEIEVLRRASRVTAVSDDDAAQFARWGVLRSSLVENGVDVKYFSPSSAAPRQNEVIFLGSLDWYPNQDAMVYMIEEIWPLIRKACPTVQMKIVGRRPTNDLRRLAGKNIGVEVVGEVDDVRPYLRKSSIVIVPLRIGGGSRIKILEALAMSKAVVSTSIGAEGLTVRDQEDIFIANSPQSFANCCIKLLSSSEDRDRLGASGRRLTLDRYAWERSAQALEDAWFQALNIKTSPSDDCGEAT